MAPPWRLSLRAFLMLVLATLGVFVLLRGPIRGTMGVLMSEPPPMKGEERYLVPLFVWEQLGKFFSHFSQMVRLADLLNATLVLPNFRDGSAYACAALDFGVYFDTTNVPARLRWMSWNHWLAVMNATHLADASVHQLVATDRGRTDAWLADKFLPCLPPNVGRAMDHSATFLFAPVIRDWGDQGESSAAHSLRRTLETAVARFPLLPIRVFLLSDAAYYDIVNLSEDSRGILQFSPALVGYARDLYSRFGRYLAVHWRMETAPAENRLRCAEALVADIEGLKARLNFSHVYFATDYPLTSLPFNSNSFLPSIENKQAAHFVLRRLQPHFWRWPLPVTDSGVLAILEAEICAHAEVFLSGPTACARSSVFTSLIRDRRLAWQRTDPSRIVDTSPRTWPAPHPGSNLPTR